ncbi:uncharacterized protein LOC131015168 [Salvia miltiorrhiza]|uniref:uncharacterized protein LOC131015168 n=1 Tax=Salvia miltiorrhiza TaxID=226208 RepID=UPI0025AC7495|nr:uncharacterized protein LOC131015168 [Salvia miltiorrhiza]
MKLKKGDKVEVMNKKESPVSWHVAEILSGDGHTYHLKYDSYPGMSSEHKVETVSRMSVRPCQPLVQGVDDYVAGDVVEIFYEYAWKAAAILNVLQGKRETKSKKISLRTAAVQKRYLVRLLGCSMESIVDGSNIRTKQTWHNGKWVLFEKSSRGAEDVTASKPSTSICHQNVNFKITLPKARAKKTPQDNCINILDENRFMESQRDSRSLKRMSPYGSSINEAHNGPIQKLRAIEKDGRKQRLAAAAAPVFEKAGSVSYPREILGDRNMHASLKIIPSAYNQMVRMRLNDVPGIRSTQLNSSDSDACSVGSCSVTDRSPNNFDMPSICLVSRETDTVDSDAESGHGSGFERKRSCLPPREEVGISIRRLELQAYRRTLEALYASGPLSWEQESMLTNLRIMLHISNDEHLTELKYLKSAKTAGQVGGMLHLLPRLEADAMVCTTIQSSTFKLLFYCLCSLLRIILAESEVQYKLTFMLLKVDSFIVCVVFHILYFSISWLVKICFISNSKKILFHFFNILVN